MKRYWKYIKPYLPAFIIGPLMMIVEVIGEVVLPKLMANIINVGVANGSVGYITGTGALMILVALLMMAGGVGGAYFGAKAAVSFAADLRKDAFDKVQTFSFANLDQFSTGSLVTRLTNDITQVQNLINMAPPDDASCTRNADWCTDYGVCHECGAGGDCADRDPDSGRSYCGFN